MQRLLNIAALLAVVIAFGLIYVKNKTHADAVTMPADAMSHGSHR